MWRRVEVNLKVLEQEPSGYFITRKGPVAGNRGPHAAWEELRPPKRARPLEMSVNKTLRRAKPKDTNLGVSTRVRKIIRRGGRVRIGIEGSLRSGARKVALTRSRREAIDISRDSKSSSLVRV